jgi:AcrR family transcriptional regulator
MAGPRKLQPEDWSRAALDAIASGGVSAVAVEAIALSLGVSKGSFYWHFPDRAALVKAAVEMWEDARSGSIINELSGIADPRARLQRLCAIAFTDAKAGRIEAALIARPDDPMVTKALRRVTEDRMAFLDRAFADLGFDKRQARARSLLFYGAYLGLFVVREGNADAVPADAGGLTVFVDDLLDLLAAPASARVGRRSEAAGLLLALRQSESALELARGRALAYLNHHGPAGKAARELAAALSKNS